jgi:hypothetical protein
MHVDGVGIWDCSSKLGKMFRRRFRMPYGCFMMLAEHFRVDHPEWKEDWMKENRNKEQGHDLRILVLCCLRILGCSYTYESINEVSHVSCCSAKKFFDEFIKWGMCKSRLVVKLPVDAEEIKRTTKQYEEEGFPGCIGSMDCVHIFWDRCPAGLRSVCKNGKNKHPSVVFQAIVDHEKKFLSLTEGNTLPEVSILFLMSTNIYFYFLLFFYLRRILRHSE